MIVPTNENLLKELNGYIYGHLEAKKALITLFSRSRMRHYQKFYKQVHKKDLIAPLKILLIGDSGTGKTMLVESLRSIYPFPLVRIDATQLNIAAGTNGSIKPKDLKKLIEDEAEDTCLDFGYLYPSLEGAIDRTIVFVDEIDKLGNNYGGDNWNQQVQASFLTMFDNKEEFAGVSFIFAGVFPGIKKSTISRSIGFHANYENTNIDCSLDDDIIKQGILPELLGRISSIVKLDVFTKKELYGILKEHLLPIKKRDLQNYYIDIEISDKEIEEIAEKAFNSKQGIRYMQRELNKWFINAEFESNVEDIIINGR